ncbi:hypothetical protein CROQUDRAFT_273358 [Cronartium quercuum f. sp. fusiforme G11]|uniref:Uncharacterized protein n=1 Tax=Cronartium quercuum f. sp. fusiforme G11 TaxID=708437 RepID=A0A9P6T797_9BASI|nr:hypothetical protein CROQUDRAFT_273358 [Cronartium quercuum f. sp. fusiforme G11]
MYFIITFTVFVFFSQGLIQILIQIGLGLKPVVSLALSIKMIWTNKQITIQTQFQRVTKMKHNTY